MSFERKRYIEKTVPSDPEDLKKSILQDDDDTSDPGAAEPVVLSPEEKQKKIDLIMKNITAHARKHNFMMAEKLREVLYETDPGAIREIFESGRLIEEEKKNAEKKTAPPDETQKAQAPSAIKKLWPGLGKLLTVEENIAIGNSLINKTFNKKTTIIKKDYKNPRLFYIRSGNVSIFSGDTSTNLNPGCFVGVKTFFNMSESQTTVMAIPGSNLDFLDLNDFRSIVSRFPDVSQKLFSFCTTSPNDINCFEYSGRERRIYSRFSLDGFVNVQLMTHSFDKWGDPFRGKLIDISQGGIAFELGPAARLPREECRGKTANIVIDPSSMKSRHPLNWRGTVVNIKQIDNEISSLHFKGDKANRYIAAIVSKLQEKNTEI